MSEVNADGTLLNPQQHLLQEVQHLTNSLMAEEPRHQDEDPKMMVRVKAANGEDAGVVGGIPHIPPAALETAVKHENKRKKKSGN